MTTREPIVKTVERMEKQNDLGVALITAPGQRSNLSETERISAHVPNAPPRWKAVADELPEVGADVLCYWGDHCPMEVGTMSEPDLWQASSDFHGFDALPTHWMELPNAPRQ